jgi:hypothetical protein
MTSVILLGASAGDFLPAPVRDQDAASAVLALAVFLISTSQAIAAHVVVLLAKH